MLARVRKRGVGKKRGFMSRWKGSRWAFKPAVFLLTRVMNVWMGTLNYRMWRYDPSADPGDDTFAGSALYVFWHEYILLPIYIRPHCRLTMLISQHEDAEVLSHIARYVGMGVIRGSTHRGGAAALRHVIQHGPGISMAIASDGPRGPRRQLAQGCVYLSSRLQIPIVLVAIGYERPWRVRRAWDRFAIPRPFSRIRTVLGPRIQVPADLDREEIEQHRQWIEQRLTELTELAEDWAEDRYVLPDSEALYRHGRGHLWGGPVCSATFSRHPVMVPEGAEVAGGDPYAG
jgi:lysophospholipid acyltransferase (LPLAT)-like uncharacterized protein